MFDDARVWGFLAGLLFILGNKSIDSAFKVLDRLIEHKLDEIEAGDEKETTDEP